MKDLELVRPARSQLSTGSRILWVLWIALSGGCSLLPRKDQWQFPQLAQPKVAAHSHNASQPPAEVLYAEAVRLESMHAAECVDFYYQAAAEAWERIEGSVLRGGPADPRHWHLYHSAVTKLLMSAERFGKFDEQGGVVTSADPRGIIPVEYHDFPWAPSDFRVLTPVEDYPSGSVQHVFRRDGLGVTLLARAAPTPRPNMHAEQLFAATAVLKPVDAANAPGQPRPFTLAFYNPVHTASIPIDNQRVRIATDITAPIAYLLDLRQRNPIENFLQPGSNQGETGLFMFEPYQPGKIPIVFVHGLLSDTSTWADLGNDLRAHPEIMARYQFWLFNYDTGGPFLKSAATLRRQLRDIKKSLDPQGTDPALNEMVLIGHSMGGLISKLQVSSSGNRLWSAFASQPLDRINTSPEIRQDLRESFFFEPSPDISRVIFIGTPHRGSIWARRWIGRLSSKLVREPQARQAEHRRLIEDNPGVFVPEVQDRIPTSIDLLDPDSRFTDAIGSLPLNPAVEAHTILGEGYWMLGQGSSDTVVPVSSASLPNTASEVRVHAKHTEIHHKPETVREVLRILTEHYQRRSTPRP